jgi:hypothetical protein
MELGDIGQRVNVQHSMDWRANTRSPAQVVDQISQLALSFLKSNSWHGWFPQYGWQPKPQLTCKTSTGMIELMTMDHRSLTRVGHETALSALSCH